MRFKEFLNEGITHYPWQVQSTKELLKLPGWKSDDKDVYFRSEHGEILVLGSFNDDTKTFSPRDGALITNELLVEYQSEFYLPFQFAYFDDECKLRSESCDKITSFIGLPDTIKNLNMSEVSIQNMIGFPSTIKQDFWFDKLPIQYKLKDYLKRAHEVLTIHTEDVTPENMYKGLLSFLVIQGLLSVAISSSFQEDYYKAINIMRNHLERDRDVLECQEEMIQAGLKEYAKL